MSLHVDQYYSGRARSQPTRALVPNWPHRVEAEPCFPFQRLSKRWVASCFLARPRSSGRGVKLQQQVSVCACRTWVEGAAAKHGGSRTVDIFHLQLMPVREDILDDLKGNNRAGGGMPTYLQLGNSLFSDSDFLSIRVVGYLSHWWDGFFSGLDLSGLHGYCRLSSQKETGRLCAAAPPLHDYDNDKQAGNIWGNQTEGIKLRF